MSTTEYWWKRTNFSIRIRKRIRWHQPWMRQLGRGYRSFHLRWSRWERRRLGSWGVQRWAQRQRRVLPCWRWEHKDRTFSRCLKTLPSKDLPDLMPSPSLHPLLIPTPSPSLQRHHSQEHISSSASSPDPKGVPFQGLLFDVNLVLLADPHRTRYDVLFLMLKLGSASVAANKLLLLKWTWGCRQNVFILGRDIIKNSKSYLTSSL